MQMKACV